jgi:peptide/nickel transport system substrate-binding protein
VSSRTPRVFKALSRRVLPAVAVLAIMLAGTASGIRASHLSGALLSSRQGGSISIRTIGPNDCMNPQLSTTNVTNQIAVATLDPLITADQKGKPSPDLATSWKLANGGKTLTFFLRHGVRFSNGDPFDATSVKWNYEHVLNPKSKSPDTGMLGPIKAVKVLNKYTVQLVMKAPFRPLFTGLEGFYLGMVDPKTTAKLGSKECSTVVGTGPYKVKSIGPAFNPIVLVRNPYHTWASPWQFNHGPGYLDQVTFKPILSDSTAISELLSGGVQISEVAPSQYSRVKGNKNITIRKYPDEGLYYLQYNFAHSPFTDPNVRRGIAEALDRSALIRAAAGGLAQPAYSEVAATVPDYDPQSPKYAPSYDPADAKNRLKGVKLPTLTLLTFNDPTSTTSGELIQAELAQIGVNVTVQPHSVADTIALLNEGRYDLALGYQSYDDPDMMYLNLIPGPTNQPWPSSMATILATVTRYLTIARQSSNPAVVRRNYITAQRYANGLTLKDPLFTPFDLFGISNHAHGWHANLFTLGYTVEPVIQDLWVSK